MAPANIVYGTALRKTSFKFRLTDGVYAFPECLEGGQIKLFQRVPKNFIIIQQVEPDCYLCSCDQNGVYDCIHIIECNKFISEDDVVLDELDNNVFALPYAGLHGIYCADSKTFSIIKESASQVRCLCCKERCQSCIHKKMFIRLRNTSHGHVPQFLAVSDEKIRYPLESNKIRQCRAEGIPTTLVPEYNSQLECPHGHTYRHEDPLYMGWKAKKKSYLHYEDLTYDVSVYFRPTVGNCDCRQDYKGSNHLIFNLDGVHLFGYEWLAHTLHNITESKMPLHASFRSVNRSRAFVNESPLKHHMYRVYRMAYNAFIRCLTAVDNPWAFKCIKCPIDGPEIIIMDGTAISCKKDQMQTNIHIRHSIQEIPEHQASNRAMFTQAIRKRLETYAGRFKGGYSDEQEVMDTREFLMLRADLPAVFHDLLAQEYCLDSLRIFLGELSTSNPPCAIFQMAGEEARITREILEEVANGDLTRVRTHSHELRKYAPLLLDFLSSEDVPHHVISDVMAYTLEFIKAPFDIPIPDETSYGITPCIEDLPLDYFPHYPPIRGLPNYSADRKRRQQIGQCNKAIKDHNTLSPGIFTVFCEHAICHGFQLMDSPESPRTPFNLLVTKFKKIPKIIVYDNACHLMLYCLKREPARFKDTVFLIDRFHSRGHTCTRGYHMDTYDDVETINAINSSLVEQANARLVNLRNQIACMSSVNAMHHIAIFIALRNQSRNVELANSK